MKKKAIALGSLGVLILSWLLLRFPLFSLNGMKQFPMALFLVGVAVIALAGLAGNWKFLPVMTAVGYPLGFFLGYLFQQDDGNELNSLWCLWLIFFLAALIIGLAGSLIRKEK